MSSLKDQVNVIYKDGVGGQASPYQWGLPFKALLPLGQRLVS